MPRREELYLADILTACRHVARSHGIPQPGGPRLLRRGVGAGLGDRGADVPRLGKQLRAILAADYPLVLALLDTD